jgi:hypothetical protein
MCVHHISSISIATVSIGFVWTCDSLFFKIELENADRIMDLSILYTAGASAYVDFFDWDMISTHKNLNLAFIDNWKNRVNWSKIVYNVQMTEQFISDHIGYMVLNDVFEYQVLSEVFIEKHCNTIALWNIASKKTEIIRVIYRFAFT